MRKLSSAFNVAMLGPIHVALRPLQGDWTTVDEDARSWLMKFKDGGSFPTCHDNVAVDGKQVLSDLLSVLDRSTGELLPESKANTSAYLNLHSLLPATSSGQPLTKEELVKKGLLLSPGNLPEGLRLDPVTGNHSTVVAKNFLSGVSSQCAFK